MNIAQQLLPLLDLTSLNATDNDNSIRQLCAQATTPNGNVAAVCVYPQFVPLVKQLIKTPQIKIVTVSNFPQSTTPLPQVVREIKEAIAMGANEIDIVMPYHEYLAGNINSVKDFITQCKNACGNNILKVILETGALQKTEIIAAASRDVLLAGADFIKTSTGKIAINATLEAAEIMLEVIRDLKLPRVVGFKAAGGIRTVAQAANYLHLAQHMMGEDWVSANTFRIGASVLMQDILLHLSEKV